MKIRCIIEKKIQTQENERGWQIVELELKIDQLLRTNI